MAYRVYLNNDNLIFDSSIQEDQILFTKAVAKPTAKGAGSFDFTIPPCHKYYGQLHRLTDYIDVYRDEDYENPIFSGRIYSITDTMNGQQSISCEGMLSILADSVYIPQIYQGTLRNLVENILDTHNVQVEAKKGLLLGNFTVDNSDVYREYLNYETSISRLNDLLSTFGGYMFVRKNYHPELSGIIDVDLVDVGYVDTGDETLYFDWVSDFTTPCSQMVELKSNLLNIKKVQDASGIATVILPLGAKQDDGTRLTIESVNSGSKVITASSEYISMYGYVVKTVTWDDVTVASNLKSKAQIYLQACLTPRTEITLTAVDLSDAGYDVDSFRVGQKIAVKAPQIGTNAVQFSCIGQTLNLLHPEQNKLELGEVRTGYVQSQMVDTTEGILVEMSREIEQSQTTMQQAIDEASDLITGNSGGYIIFHDGDNDGYPDEILVMDTANIQTAVKVLRINKNGIGFSSSGYSGTYSTAWSLNGIFNASFITAGTMLGNRIRAGLIESENGNSSWNLNTGKLYSTLVELTGKIIANEGRVGNFEITDGALIYGDISERNNGITLTPQQFAISYYQDRYRTYRYRIYQNANIWQYAKDNSASYKEVGRVQAYQVVTQDNSDCFALNVKVGTNQRNLVQLYDTMGSHTSGLVYINGDVEILGRMAATTKSRVVDIDEYGRRYLYCYETPSPIFGDVGEGVIGDDGLSYIWLDPVFAQTIITDDYQVFLQKYGSGDCWIQERHPGYFIVQGTPGLAFGWELKGKQVDLDQFRMDSADIYYTTSSDLGSEAANYIQSLYEGRINAA